MPGHMRISTDYHHGLWVVVQTRVMASGNQGDQIAQRATTSRNTRGPGRKAKAFSKPSAKLPFEMTQTG